MNPLALIPLLLIAYCGNTWAHDGVAEDGTAQTRDHSDGFVSKLQLTPEQTPKVKEILSAQREKRHAIYKSDKEKSQKMADMESLRADTREQLSTVLSAEQLVKFDEMASNWQQHRKGKGGHGKSKPDSGAAPEASAPAPSADAPPAAPPQN